MNFSPQVKNPTDNCIICNKPTDKCCSLCKKVYYCSTEHQEVDWHMKHKFMCEGRVQGEQDPHNQFKIYSVPQEEPIKSEKKMREEYQQRDEALIGRFVGMLEKRVSIRQKIINQFQKVTEQSPTILLQSLVHQTVQLLNISEQIQDSFKPSLEKYLKQEFSLTLNKFILNIEWIGDSILLCKAYDNAGMSQNAKQELMSIVKELEEFPTQNANDCIPYLQTYKTVLLNIVQLSERYMIDKITERMYGRYVRVVEQFEGIWEQVYAYYHVGVWYCKKTYYQKGIKAFQYSLSLMASHKKDVPDTILFRADCHYNIGLGYWACGNQLKAMEEMQEAYKDRVNGLGKNSFESSNCLYKLAEWYKHQQKWQQCIKYLDECHRIRKQHPQRQQSLQSIKTLIAQVYSNIKQEKTSSEQRLEPKEANYFSRLLERDATVEEKMQAREEEFRKVVPDESFSRRLLKSEKEWVMFKVNVSPEMFEGYSPQQIMVLSQLFEKTDERMEKKQAIQLIMDSKFFHSLSPPQKTEFLAANSLTS